MTDAEIEKLDGEALAAAVAEQVMRWQPWPSQIGAVRWKTQTGEILSTSLPYGESLNRLLGWRPYENIAQAFQVMRARPEWQWIMQEWRIVETAVSVGLCGLGRPYQVLETRVSVIDGDWTRAWCLAICRAALKAVQVRA